MKKIIILLSAIFLFTFTGCSRNQVEKDTEKYRMDTSIAYGSAEDSGLEKTKISYDIVINGAEQDIENIAEHELLVNPEYIHLLLENTHHKPISVPEEKENYFQVTGSFIFNTSEKTKEEINEMDLFKGIKIFYEDGSSYILTLNSYDGK